MTQKRRIKPLIRNRRVTRWLKQIAVLATLLLAIAAGVAVWGFRTGRAVEFVRQEILTELKTRCELDAEFKDLRVDPLGRDFTLTDLIIRDKGGRRLLAVTSAQASVAFWPLLYGRFQLKQVALLAPQAHIRVIEGRLVDLPACVEPMEGSGAPINLGVSELAVERGRFALDVDDQLSAQLDDIGVVLTSESGGGMSLAVGVDDTDIVFRGRPLNIARFRLEGRLEGLLSRPRAVVVDALDVRTGPIRIGGSGKVDLLGPVYDAKLQVAAPLGVVNEYVPEAPALQGDAALDVAVAGTMLFFPRVSGDLTVQRGQIDDFKLGDRVRAQFAVDDTGIRLLPATVELADGEVSVRGRIAFDEAMSVRLETRTRRASLARILDAVGNRDVTGDFLGTGRTTLRGTLRPLVLEGPLDFKVRDLLVGAQPWNHPLRIGRAAAELDPSQRMLWIREGQIAGRWRFDKKGLDLSDILVATGTTTGVASAYLPFGKNGKMRIRAEFPNFAFEDVGPIAQVPFAGRGRFEATMSGPYSKVGATGRLSLRGVEVANAPLGDITAQTRWYDLRRLDFTDVQQRLGSTQFAGRVGVLIQGAVPLDISGRITEGRIEDLFRPFRVDPAAWGSPSGKLEATVDVQGPVTRLTGPVDARLGDGEIYGERWQRGRVVGRFEAGRIVIEGLELTKYRGRVLATGFLDPNRGDVEVIARTRRMNLQSVNLIRANQERLNGNMVARVKVGGSVHGLTGTVSVSLSDMKAGPVPLGRGRVYGRLHGATLSLTGDGLEGAAQLKGDVMLTSGLPYRADIDLKNVDAPAIVAGLMGYRSWRGNTTAQANLSGGLIDWTYSSGQLQVEDARLETPRFTLGLTSPAALTLDRGVLEAKERLSLGGPQSQLTVRGRFGRGIVDLRVGGRVDLAVAELIGPSIEKAGGQLKLDAAVGGTLDVLNLVGTGRIEGGTLKWQGIEDRVTAYTADLTFSQSSVLIDKSAGRFAGGRIGVTGSVLLEKFFPKNVALQVNLRQARPRFATRTMDVSGAVSGKLTINGPFKRMMVRGGLDVERGLAKPKIEWSSLVGSRAASAVYDPANEIVEYDILLRSDAGFRIRNQDADVTLLGSFRFTGTNERMGMLGTLPVDQGGRVVFLGREYTFQSGTLNMTERYRFAPRYDLRLSSESCDASITIDLVGTLAKFELTYRSNPEMDQRDIVSCLIRGVKISDLDQDLASFAGSALLKLSGVDQEVKKVLLIDQIEVTTEYSSLSRAYEPRVLVAKNLSLLDRPARLEYSTSLLRTNDQRAAFRVRLTPQLNLQFGWTSSEDVPFGDWGLDLKQRWEW